MRDHIDGGNGYWSRCSIDQPDCLAMSNGYALRPVPRLVSCDVAPTTHDEHGLRVGVVEQRWVDQAFVVDPLIGLGTLHFAVQQQHLPEWTRVEKLHILELTAT